MFFSYFLVFLYTSVSLVAQTQGAMAQGFNKLLFIVNHFGISVTWINILANESLLSFWYTKLLGGNFRNYVVPAPQLQF